MIFFQFFIYNDSSVQKWYKDKNTSSIFLDWQANRIETLSFEKDLYIQRLLLTNCFLFFSYFVVFFGKIWLSGVPSIWSFAFFMFAFKQCRKLPNSIPTYLGTNIMLSVWEILFAGLISVGLTLHFCAYWLKVYNGQLGEIEYGKKVKNKLNINYTIFKWINLIFNPISCLFKQLLDSTQTDSGKPGKVFCFEKTQGNPKYYFLFLFQGTSGASISDCHQLHIQVT